jgi:hypothetical protein
LRTGIDERRLGRPHQHPTDATAPIHRRDGQRHDLTGVSVVFVEPTDASSDETDNPPVLARD